MSKMLRGFLKNFTKLGATNNRTAMSTRNIIVRASWISSSTLRATKRLYSFVDFEKKRNIDYKYWKKGRLYSKYVYIGSISKTGYIIIRIFRIAKLWQRSNDHYRRWEQNCNQTKCKVYLSHFFWYFRMWIRVWKEKKLVKFFININS
jgi:hypothetical protein